SSSPIPPGDSRPGTARSISGRFSRASKPMATTDCSAPNTCRAGRRWKRSAGCSGWPVVADIDLLADKGIHCAVVRVEDAEGAPLLVTAAGEARPGVAMTAAHGFHIASV